MKNPIGQTMENHASMRPTDSDAIGFPDLFPISYWRAFANRYDFTARETDVFRLVCRGLGNESIASQLGIQVPTLRSHLRAVYSKLGCHDRVYAVILAMNEMTALKHDQPN